MSNSTARRRFNGSPILEWVQRFGAIITVAAIAVFGFWGGHFLLPGQEHSEPETEVAESSMTEESASITLPAGKLAAANLKSEVVVSVQFQGHKTVPGTIVYDETKKVEIRATVDSVVKETLVKPADRVQQGQPVLLVTDPEIGAARNEISQCESRLGLLEKEHAWTEDTHTNMADLLEYLKQSPSPDQVKTRFENKNLGEHRNDVLSAYSELALARKTYERASRLKSQGAISGKEADERRSGFDVASAKFNSIREEMNFQSTQQLTRSLAGLEAEKKQLEICREKLRSLLGPQDETSTSQPSLTKSAAEFVITAPQSGQVVVLQAVKSSRFEPGEVMVVIADISDVWVEAQISQRDWHSLKLEPGQILTVRVPALPDMKFSAVVKHIGATVSKTTMAIPLVVELDNEASKFRPGMSVWVDVPTSEPRASSVVSVGAVQRIDMQPVVFVQTGDDTFVSKSVTIGEESQEQVEIQSGLSPGDKVVVEGAFFLKSEMLLAEEEE